MIKYKDFIKDFTKHRKIENFIIEIYKDGELFEILECVNRYAIRDHIRYIFDFEGVLSYTLQENIINELIIKLEVKK